MHGLSLATRLLGCGLSAQQYLVCPDFTYLNAGVEPGPASTGSGVFWVPRWAGRRCQVLYHASHFTSVGAGVPIPWASNGIRFTAGMR